jgi:transcription-repair coupling factor (superfamily II helicase)
VRAKANQLTTEHPQLSEMLDRIAAGIPVEGMESLAPALLDGSDSLELLIDTLPTDTHVLLCDPERIRTRAHDLVRTSEEFLQASWAAAAVGGKTPVDLGAASFKTLADVRSQAGRRGQPWWTVSPFGLVETVRPRSDDDEPWRDPDEDRLPDIADDNTVALDPWRATDAAVPRRDRPGRRRPEALERRRVAGRRGVPGQRPGRAGGGGAP